MKLLRWRLFCNYNNPMTKSFLAKLAGIEDEEEETASQTSPQEIEIRQSVRNPIIEETESQSIDENAFVQEFAPSESAGEEKTWLEGGTEGQLAIDVYQTPESIVIKSTIAGARPEEIDISINNDMVTIRGQRFEDATTNEEDYLYQEIYWGGFSRSIVLPVEVNADESEAALKNGVLTITLPKAKKTKSISVKVKGE